VREDLGGLVDRGSKVPGRAGVQEQAAIAILERPPVLDFSRIKLLDAWICSALIVAMATVSALRDTCGPKAYHRRGVADSLAGAFARSLVPARNIGLPRILFALPDHSFTKTQRAAPTAIGPSIVRV
jgi:hypothetical protein